MAPNAGFRLWLSMDPAAMDLRHPPVQLLQACVKVALEPPDGLPAQLALSFGAIADFAAQNSTSAMDTPQFAKGGGAEGLDTGGLAGEHSLLSAQSSSRDAIGLLAVLRAEQSAKAARALAAPGRRSPFQQLTKLIGDSHWQPNVMAATLFHSVMMERRLFGPMGCRYPYELLPEDLIGALEVMCRASQHDGNTDMASLLQYMIAHCVYSGKLAHVPDGRMLRAVLRDFIGPDAHAPKKALALLCQGFSSGGGDMTAFAMRRWFEKLAQRLGSDPHAAQPFIPLLQVHPSALQLRHATVTHAMLGRLAHWYTLQSQQHAAEASAAPVASAAIASRLALGGGAFSPVDSATLVRALAAVQDLLTQLPQMAISDTDVTWMACAVGGNVAHVQSKLPPERLPASQRTVAKWQGLPREAQQMLAAVFRSEVLVAEALLERLNASIDSFVLAVRGQVPLTSEHQRLASDLATHYVPDSWMSPCVPLPPGEPPLLPVWLRALRARLDFVAAWSAEGPPPVVPLPLLLQPAVLVTQLLQRCAVEQQVSIADCAIESYVLPPDITADDVNRGFRTNDVAVKLDDPRERITVGQALADGCLVSGLKLQGAKWDGRTGALAEPDPSSSSPFSPLPLLWLRPRAIQRPPSVAAMLGGGGGGGADVSSGADSLQPAAVRSTFFFDHEAGAAESENHGRHKQRHNNAPLAALGAALGAKLGAATAAAEERPHCECPVYSSYGLNVFGGLAAAADGRGHATTSVPPSEEVVLSVRLPCGKLPLQHWASRGVALFLVADQQ